jgi:isopenicillin N synthase-like dioxygenase
VVDKKKQGVHATNRDYIGYEQVDKGQSYRFAEGTDARAPEAFDEDFQIQTCDLSRLVHGDPASRRAVADELGQGLREIGFAVLSNTGISGSLYDRADAATRELFESTTLVDKLRYRAQRLGSINQGYFPIKETSDIHPDLVEGWVFCRRAFDLDPAAPADLPHLWPNPALEPVFRELCLAHERLILPITQALLAHLGQDPHLFDRRLTGTNYALRLNYYPPVSSEDDASGAGRLLGHEDVNLFTLLPAPTVEGLQVLNRRNNKWIRVCAPPGSIILNTGDYMQRISNDLLPSTTHRVSKPRDSELLGRTRVSFPMNVYLWEDELLEVLPGLGTPRYEPIKALTFHTRTTSKFYGDDYAVEPPAPE